MTHMETWVAETVEALDSRSWTNVPCTLCEQLPILDQLATLLATQWYYMITCIEH